MPRKNILNKVHIVHWSYRIGRSWIGCLVQWVEVRQGEEGKGEPGEELMDVKGSEEG